MAISLDEVLHLQKTPVQLGSRWIYVADFNIKHTGTNLKSTDRIDTELEDARYILEQGGRVLFLAHKGRYQDQDTEDLDFVVPYLHEQLGVEVAYYPDNTTSEAIDYSKNLAPGTAAVMGNTRKHFGEEKNYLKLAEQFALLGDFVAVGGFGKAHRAHASNVGILNFLPGYLTQSQLTEMESLVPFAGSKQNAYSVAVLGGVKKEKVTVGLLGFAESYDAIIPGGIVLNSLLKGLGHNIGDSLLEDGGKTFVDVAMFVYNGLFGDKILLPDTVIISKKTESGFSGEAYVSVSHGVPEGYMIVDSVLPPPAVDALEKVKHEQGRIVLAGTPGIYNQGFRTSTDLITFCMNQNRSRSIVLGGDTSAEVGFDGPTSTGGGSALHFAAYGTTPVFEALKANKQRFSL